MPTSTTTCRRWWSNCCAPERGDLTGLRADYDAVNDILAETLPEVLRSLGTVSRWVNVLAGSRW